MSFFDKIRETFRDKTRDKICAQLQNMGIDAQMAERGRAEEKAGGEGSLGIIDISEEPIRCTNVRKVENKMGYLHGVGVTMYYCTEYVVPDNRLGTSTYGLQIKSVHVSTSPLFGRVIDLRWEGEDLDTGIINRLNSDMSLKHPLMKSYHDVTIYIFRDYICDYSCWIISTQTDKAPSRELWNCYQEIARHLLADWLQSDKAHR